MVGVDFTEKLTFEERLEAWKAFIARIYKRVFQVAATASAKALEAGTETQGERNERSQGREEMGSGSGQIFEDRVHSLTFTEGNGKPEQHFEQSE